MEKKDLLKLIEDDEFDLLAVKPGAAAVTEGDRLIAAFNEIGDFINKAGREPEPNKSDISEFKLFSRLAAIRADAQKRSVLAKHDKFNLLSDAKKIESVKDIFADDDLGLLSKREAVLELKNVPKTKTPPDYVAKRKPCKNFDEFKVLFATCQADLKSGKRRLMPFSKELQIGKGLFFVLKGVLLYVDKMLDKESVPNPRLRCIYENGTESDILRHSLGAALYKDGKRVTEHQDKLLDSFKDISADDKQMGFVYILRSLSTKPEIQSQRNLFKVGFSTQPVEQRIKNAANEATYLMAPVAIVTTFRCYNFNPIKLEGLLHDFFGTACLEISVVDAKGIECSPREWFIAPLDVIEQAVQLVISGEIIQFKYDRAKMEIVGR